MKIPKRIEKSSDNTLSKKDAKNMLIILDKINYKEDIADLKIIKCKEKLNILVSNGKTLLFSIGKSEFLPCIKIIDDDYPMKVAYLDDGAKKPLLSGADVMVPGIFKFIDKIEHWNKGEYLIVKVEDEIFGIGIATVDSKSINANSTGIGIEMIHVKNDALYNYVV